jgi:HAD superfamily hydrolase (TIGR01509 family)
VIDEHDAILFDCDGVLVNSELIAQRIERQLLESVGMTYPREEYVRRFSGMYTPAYQDALREDARTRFGFELDDELFVRMDEAIHSAYPHELKAISGARALAFDWPKAKAVASSSSLRSVLNKLRATGLAGAFGEHVYSAETVKVGKPDPAIFRHAADGLGVDHSRCLVVEDSVNGIIAAKRAGMTAVGFIGGGHCLDDHADHLYAGGADTVFSALEDLHRHLGLAPAPASAPWRGV